MNNSRHTEPSPSLTLGDIYFVVFRHKWKILALAAAGLAAAGIYFFLKQPPYQSEAELLIRYVQDSRSVNPTENNSRVTSLMDLGASVMNSEMHILSSFDLAAQVATNIGPAKILAKYGGGSDPTRAAFVVRQNLKVEGGKDSSVIHITFYHFDPDIVRPVLSEIITDYLEKHQEVHKAIGMSDDTLTEQTTQLRLQIAQTEDELRMAKTNAGIINIADSEKAYSEEIARIRRELFQAEADLAERQMSLSVLSGRQGTTNAALIANIPAEAATQYKTACTRLAYLQKRAEDYLILQGFTEQNKLVKEARSEIVQASKTKADLETRYPALADMDMAATVSIAGPTEYSTNMASLTSLPMRVKILREQLNRIQSDAAKLDEAEAKISDLERKKKVQEDNYKYFANTLEEARINEALGPGRVSNIKAIQTPSPPFKDFDKFYKNMLLMSLGGLLAGLCWAFLVEYYLDHSIKRPSEIYTKLKIPFFLSIPDLNQQDRPRITGPEKRPLELTQSGTPVISSALEVTPGQVNHALRSHYDALRDRLVTYFESINLTRKPKLVAVTSANRGAGVSTIAAGLAASLSETGDGRVLLVDMNLEQGAAQQFIHGKPGCKLDDALVSGKRENAMVQENLYVVTEYSNADLLPRALPKRFASLVPKLKASDYDYIIFDMPPVSQTSVTLRLAGFMDNVMLVVESEKTDREAVQQASALLAQSKTSVTAVLNKTRKYVPARLHHDLNPDV